MLEQIKREKFGYYIDNMNVNCTDFLTDVYTIKRPPSIDIHIFKLDEAKKNNEKKSGK